MIDTIRPSFSIDFKTAFEAAPGRHILLLADEPVFTIAAVSAAYEKASGLSKELLLGRGIFDVFPPNPQEGEENGSKKLRHSLKRVISSGEDDVLDFRYDIPDQKGGFLEKYWRTVNRPISHEDGLKYIIHSTEEISDSVKAATQGEQIRSMTEMHNIFMQAPIAIHIFKGNDLQIELANEPSLRLWGRDKSVIGQKLKDVFPEIAGQGYIALLQKVMESGMSQSAYEQPVKLHKDGIEHLQYINYVFHPYYETNSTAPTGVLAFVNDVTDRVGVNTQSEQRFQQIANTLPIVVWTAAPDGNLTYISDQWERHYGNPVKESLGTGWARFVHTDDVQDAAAKWSRSLETGEPYETEFRVAHKTDGWHWLLVRALPIKNSSGKIQAWYGSNTDIQDKKRVEQTILESEERFRTMAEGSDVLILVGDEQGRPNYFNKGWTEITGRSREDLLQKGWTDLIHPDEREQWRKIYLGAFENKEAFGGEFRLLDKEGKYRWMLGRAPARFRPDGSFAGHISSCFDITERKQAEEALKESIQQVRSIVESAPFPIGVYTGREMRIALANQSIIDVWGKGGNLVGNTYAEMLPELEGTGIYQQLDDVFTTGIPFHAKNTRVDLVKDGKLQLHYFNYSFTPLYDSAGKIYGVMNTAAEVTDLNLSRQRAEESESQLQFAIEATELGTFDYDPVSNKFTANDRLKNWFGLPPESEIDLQLAINAVAEHDRERVTETIKRSLVFSSGGKYDIEYTIINPHTNKDIHVRAKGMVWFNENRAAYRLNGTMQDITEQVTAFQKIEEIVAERTKELADANNNLKHSNAELAQFAYIASHDLQEPLRKISVFSDMLAMHLGEKGIDAQAQNFITKINNSSARMTTLVRDVLLYSELSKEQKAFQRVSLQQVIEEIKTDFELLITEKKAKIFAENLPVIDAIPLQMSQLFGNLISNSIKYSRENVSPQISITAKKLSPAEEEKYADDGHKNYYRLSVKDNGIGFDPSYAEKIFSIFQRLHEKSAYAGTGIGLAMCRKIVQNHHGEISADSTGKGAEFVIILPSVLSRP